MTRQDYVGEYVDNNKVTDRFSEHMKLRIEGIEQYKEVVGVFADIWNTGQSVFGDGSYIFDIFEQYVKERRLLESLEKELLEKGINPMGDKRYITASTHVKKTLLDVEKMKMDRSMYLLKYETAKEKKSRTQVQDENTIKSIVFEDDE